jgi:hypothetical protein
MKLRTIIFFLAATIVASVSIWWTFTTFVALSGFAAALGKAVLGALAFWLTDEILLRDIDTITELKKQNIAYAIFILSYAIILAACISTA